MKILVIENNPEELRKAGEILTEAGIEVVCASDFEQASEFLGIDGFCPGRGSMDKPQVDGVLSDIFFPLIKDGYFNDQYMGDDDPIGVAVATICREQKLPCILVTSQFHHGAKLQWVTMMVRALGMPEIEDQYPEESSKPWERGLEELLKLI